MSTEAAKITSMYTDIDTAAREPGNRAIVRSAAYSSEVATMAEDSSKLNVLITGWVATTPTVVCHCGGYTMIAGIFVTLLVLLVFECMSVPILGVGVRFEVAVHQRVHHYEALRRMAFRGGMGGVHTVYTATLQRMYRSLLVFR
jgi:hypothetical protein